MRSARALVALVAAALLAGCGGMPTSGPVEAGEDLDAQPRRQQINVDIPPEPGADEVGIVQGFVLASGSYESGFPGPREYLTDGVRAQWDPSARIQVFDPDQGYTLTRTAPGEVAVSLPLVGTVDAQGTYELAPPGTVTTEVVRLEQVDGEWRISQPPTGLLVSAFDFARQYGTYDAYFLDPSGDVLVPDEIVLPNPGNRATLLAQALLDGPSSWLSPGVRTAFPEGTELALRAVDVEGGTARVSLSEEARQVEGLERTRMAAQLALTLAQEGDVTQVAIEAGGTPLVVPGAVDGVVSVGSFRSFDASTQPGAPVYAVRDGAVVTVLDDRTEAVGGPLANPDVGAQSVAVALDSSSAAVVDESGRSLAVSGFESGDLLTPVTTSATSLATPTWDRTRTLWFADRTGTGSRLYVSDVAGVQPVGGLSLEDVRVEVIRMAPDGVRLLMVVSTGGRTEVRVGLVRRPDSSEPTRGVELISMRTVPLPSTVIADAAWSGTQELSVLGGSVDGDLEPYEVDVSGAGLTPQGVATGADSLAGAARNPLVVGTADGQLLQQDAFGSWQPVGEGRQPTYPG